MKSASRKTDTDCGNRNNVDVVAFTVADALSWSTVATELHFSAVRSAAPARSSTIDTRIHVKTHLTRTSGLTKWATEIDVASQSAQRLTQSSAVIWQARPSVRSISRLCRLPQWYDRERPRASRTSVLLTAQCCGTHKCKGCGASNSRPASINDALEVPGVSIICYSRSSSSATR